MSRTLVDTTVLFAAAYRRDGAHDDALLLLKGVDAADLPEVAIPDSVLAETLNGLTTHAGHDAAVDFLDRIEENTRFHLDALIAATFATANALFRQYGQFSLVDACIVAYVQSKCLGYLYAFDEDFDEVYRLDTATNPYRPE